ncbi:hypothetical protein CHUAL_003454 [Chamberlinius hualienensis]
MFEVNISTCLVLSIAVHLILLIYGEFHDNNFDVKYTDIDYHVFSDAAVAASQGRSPFDRETYRYTPILAWILVPCVLIHRICGKLLFCAADVAVGYLTYRILRSQGINRTKSLYCCSAWLFNPMSIVVSSRGNAESIMALLVLFSLLLVLKVKPRLAGIVYGFSVHFKIYPVIYSVPFYFALGPQWVTKRKQKQSNFLNYIWPTADRLMFLIYSAVGFLLPTFLCYLVCGEKYIDEAFLYHISRRDTQHNFSPYFYILRQFVDTSAEKWASIACFLPQFLAVLVCIIKYRRRSDLPFCIFMETYAFVTFNKVCTSQYFLWYLSLVQLVIPKLKFQWLDLFRVGTLWVSSQAVWLFAAYAYEFRGANTLLYVWIASLAFLLSNIFVLRFFKMSYKS